MAEILLRRTEKSGIPLVGPIDGVNVIFMTPDKFVYGTIEVQLNGVTIEQGAGNDYLVSESGGLGSGYDTITLLFLAKPGDKLWARYTKSA